MPFPSGVARVGLSLTVGSWWNRGHLNSVDQDKLAKLQSCKTTVPLPRTGDFPLVPYVGLDRRSIDWKYRNFRDPDKIPFLFNTEKAHLVWLFYLMFLVLRRRGAAPLGPVATADRLSGFHIDSPSTTITADHAPLIAPIRSS